MATLDNFLFVGDSFTDGLKNYGIGDSYGKDCEFVCKNGVTAKQLMGKSF